MPGPTSVTVKLLIVQTDAVDDVTVTGNPELAVAATVNGDCAMVALAGLTNVIDWGALVTVNERVTGCAGW